MAHVSWVLEETGAARAYEHALRSGVAQCGRWQDSCHLQRGRVVEGDVLTQMSTLGPSYSLPSKSSGAA